MKRFIKVFLVAGILFFPFAFMESIAQKPGLLFHLSGNGGLKADYAAGDPVPNYMYNISIIPDGAQGAGIHCGHEQLLSYWAPKNIYAQRGTL